MMSESSPVRLLGIWSAWMLAVLYAVYVATLLAGGVMAGVPDEPYLAVAEILTMVGGLLQVILMAAIYQSAPPNARASSLVALVWMSIMAGLTMTVHFVQLTVGRQIDPAAMPGFAYVFGWTWPSLLYAVELAAWHLFFGLSLLFAVPAFRRGGLNTAIRIGLVVAAALCLVGLAGPAVGDLNLRMTGVVGYGLVFPIVCVLIGLAFRRNGLGFGEASGMPAENEPRPVAYHSARLVTSEEDSQRRG